jgi:hypothetical protein
MDMSFFRSALPLRLGARPGATSPDTARADAFALGAQSAEAVGLDQPLLGASLRATPPQNKARAGAKAPRFDPDITIYDDFTQEEGLEMAYDAGHPAPKLTLFYNIDMAGTEVRLDELTVALVRMRPGQGPLRASAITLLPEHAF